MDGGGWSAKSAEEAAASNLSWPHEGLKLFCNFSCDDMIPANGSTECWLGSHLETATADRQSHSSLKLALDELAELRRPVHPPVQITVPKGAVAFRDLRVWHRGMPNAGELPRHMISLGYGAERDPTAECSHLGAGKHKHLFGNDAKPAFARAPGKPVLVDTMASFVEGAVDHFGNPDPGEDMLGIPCSVPEAPLYGRAPQSINQSINQSIAGSLPLTARVRVPALCLLTGRRYRLHPTRRRRHRAVWALRWP